MTCKEFNQTMKLFFNQAIKDDHELDEFIHHYHTCKECREEMEIQYVLTQDQDVWESDDIYDFSGLLAKEMRKEEESLDVCKQVKRIHFRIMICTFFVIAIVLFYQFLYWMR